MKKPLISTRRAFAASVVLGLIGIILVVTGVWQEKLPN